MTETEPAVVLTRVLPGSCAEIFRAWTEPAMLKTWLAPGPNVVERAETDLRVGGDFLLETRGPEGTRHRILGRYKSLEPDRRLVQTWIYDGPLDLLAGVETELEIGLRAIDDFSTELTLTHRRISREDVREAYRGDWPTCFDKLESALNQ